jgi:glucose-1-phosphate thymidylyltransferase
MGFPDILFRPANAYERVLAHLIATQADAVLGLFPLPDTLVDDMMELDHTGRVRRYYVKQRVPDLKKITWNVAVWTPRFTQFMHEYLHAHLEHNEAPRTEFITGRVFEAAVNAGLNVQTVELHDGRYLDIGTPGGLQQLPAFLGMLADAE